MADVTYDSIAPLVHRSSTEGTTLQVSFKCPVSEAEVQSQATLRRGKGVKDVAMSSAKRGLMASLRRSVMGAVRAALGHGLLGRVGQDVARSVLSDADQKVREHFTEDEKQAATVDAFERVKSEFVWDPKGQRFVSAKVTGATPSAFSKQLAEAPVTERYDRGVLARMLVEIANADGRIEPEEIAFLSGFITDDIGTVPDLLAKPPLSGVELSETSTGGVRETLLMLAWAAAMTDEDLAEAEKKKLEDFAQGLALHPDRAESARRAAQSHLLDQAIEAAYARGFDDAKRQEVLQLGANLGMEPDEAERAEIRYRKAHGLV